MQGLGSFGPTYSFFISFFPVFFSTRQIVFQFYSYEYAVITLPWNGTPQTSPHQMNTHCNDSQWAMCAPNDDSSPITHWALLQHRLWVYKNSQQHPWCHQHPGPAWSEHDCNHSAQPPYNDEQHSTSPCRWLWGISSIMTMEMCWSTWEWIHAWTPPHKPQILPCQFNPPTHKQAMHWPQHLTPMMDPPGTCLYASAWLPLVDILLYPTNGIGIATQTPGGPTSHLQPHKQLLMGGSQVEWHHDKQPSTTVTIQTPLWWKYIHSFLPHKER